MGELTQIPEWLLAKKHFSGGIRSPKRGRWYDSENRTVFNRKTGTGFGGYQPNLALNTFGISGELNPLTQGDFRYWNGLTLATNRSYAACRNCGEIHHSHKTRKEHLKQEGCGSKLTNAYRLLAKDDRCVICNDKTRKKNWGIPLCSKDCEHEWAYVTRRPDALVAALDLVAREAS